MLTDMPVTDIELVTTDTHTADTDTIINLLMNKPNFTSILSVTYLKTTKAVLYKRVLNLFVSEFGYTFLVTPYYRKCNNSNCTNVQSKLPYKFCLKIFVIQCFCFFEIYSKF